MIKKKEKVLLVSSCVSFILSWWYLSHYLPYFSIVKVHHLLLGQLHTTASLNMCDPKTTQCEFVFVCARAFCACVCVYVYARNHLSTFM